MNFPIGPIINSSAVLLGGLIGGLFGKYIPKRVSTALSLIFGACSMSMGISYIVKVNTLPVVILSVIVGTAIGELIYLESGVSKGVGKVKGLLGNIAKPRGEMTDAEWMERFIAIVVLFCVSGTGIFGALQGGMTGDHTILITKSILDLFTAATFAASLGSMVAVIFIPQFIIQLALFYGAAGILPITDDLMRADFTACGGVLMLATGFRISGIKSFPIANMIPAMLLVMPVSWLWVQYIIPLLVH